MGTTGRERMLSLIVSSTTSSAPSSSRTAAVRRSRASGQRTSRSHVQASWFAVVSWPASTSVSSSSRSSRSVSASPSSVRARISSDMMSVRSSRSVARRRSAIIWKVGRSITFKASLVRPTGSARPMLVSSPIWATGLVDSSVRRRVASRSPRSGVPFAGLPSTPKIPRMITSSVMACIRGASAIGSPTGQRSSSRSVISSIIST